VVSLQVPSKELETTTVTLNEIIYHRRVRVLDHAGTHGVASTCRTFGISRQSYYRWADRAARYGLSALMPKARRSSCQPNVTPAHIVEIVLAEAIARPTLGARRLLEHLAEREVVLSASGVQRVLLRHRLGHRRERVAALAQITAAEAGLVTEEARSGPFGFCHFAARPGDLVALDTFYVGKLKGVGSVFQLTAIDTTTRWTVAKLIVGDKSAEVAARFVDEVIAILSEIGIELSGVLSDNGPEFDGKAFTRHLSELGITHHRIPARSPNHNAVCERVQGTILQEFYRPAFHRQRFDTLAELDTQLQGFLHRYNTRRRNHGDYMAGRIPLQVLEAHLASTP
jgi:transposase InsO family protein